MSGPSKVLFSLHGDPVLIESREDEDRFLQRLVADLHEEQVVVEPARVDQIDSDSEEEDLEEDPMEEPEPEHEGEQGAADEADMPPVEEGPMVDPVLEDDVWIADPLEESDEESHIDWDEVLRHIDDPPPAGWDDDEGEAPVEHPGLDAEGEGFIDGDVIQHFDELPAGEHGIGLMDLDGDLYGGVFGDGGLEDIQEDPIWDFPEQEMEEGPGEPEVIDLDPSDGEGQYVGDDIMEDMMHQAHHHVQAAREATDMFAGLLNTERQLTTRLTALLGHVRAERDMLQVQLMHHQHETARSFRVLRHRVSTFPSMPDQPEGSISRALVMDMITEAADDAVPRR